MVGLGARPDRSAAELTAAVEAALAEAGIPAAEVVALATVDRRAGEEGVRAVAAGRGWRLMSFAPEELRAHDVPNRSETVAAAVGTPGVAEAAALAAAGTGGTLILPKRVFGGVTVAVSTLPR
ncbi:cobalamin biosynthesis protein [Actinoplanes sp. KI2]|uniref:cobalamin biosynthesis protein n=1 Tax=Actinoplanes sp. KI2 TaxID=2983315 RepID=UPI0021D6027E|nr:cobalamin biosynthesis protein [Actinoplanes sp. KI2]MCU7726600.1 cobalamin biosynthesis protein [Actinoplanes sp. KI2]